MPKPNKAQSDENKESKGTFEIPFSLESFQADIVEVFFFYLRVIGWMSGAEAAWRIASTDKAPDADLNKMFDRDSTASSLGLTYNHIRGTRFARLLERLYHFAYFGRLDASAGAIEFESEYTWIAAIVNDAEHGEMSSLSALHGKAIGKSASNCLEVVELANARTILEGDKAFKLLEDGASNKDDLIGVSKLTIRQMALLSGMKEMSIRAAANPERPNTLKTIISGAKNTFVDPAVAKAWLQLKGLYVPIVREWSEGEFDLKTRHFSNFFDLANALDARCCTLVERGSEEALRAQLSNLGLALEKDAYGNPCLSLDESHIYGNTGLLIEETHVDNTLLVKGLATALQLPEDFFALRVNELIALEKLAHVQWQLRELNKAKSTVNS